MRARDQHVPEDALRAFADLSDSLAQYEEKQLGEYELYRRLTGSRQLWWRCCRDAVQSRPGWLRQVQRRRTLQLIRRGEPPQSGGAVFSAAEAAGWISQALAGDNHLTRRGSNALAGRLADSGGPRELVARAASRWSSSRALPRPQDGIMFPSKATLPGVSPDLRDRVGVLLGWLEDPGRDAGQAMVAISALMLAGAQAHPRRVVRVPVVLADRRTPEVKGVAGTLELRDFPAGPPGLFPDPSSLKILRADTKFDQALRLAWDFAVSHHDRSRCVLWRLTLDADAPDFAVDGGSLGAAFAIALRELLRRGPASGPSALARPRGFFMGLRPRCAITGVVSAQRPPTPAAGTSGAARDGQLWLGAVGGMEAKLQAARNQGWRLIAPTANRELDSARVPETVHVDWAASVRQADRYARRVRPVRTLLVVLSVLALGAGSTGAVAASLAHGDAVHERDAAISSQLIAQSETLGDTDPVVSKLMSIAAWRFNPSSDARSAMLAAATRPGIAVLTGHTGKVSSVAFSPDSKTLASGSYDGTVRLWDVATHRVIGQLLTGHASFVNSVAFSPDGKTLASGSYDGTVRLWDAATHRQIGNPLTGHAGDVNSVAFSPDGKTLASGSGDGVPGGGDGTVRLWDVATHREIGQPLTTGHIDTVSSVAFSPDGKMLAIGSYDDTVRLWDLATHQWENPLQTTSPVTSVAFSPDSTTLASASYNEDTVRLWSVSASGEIRQQPLTGHTDTVNSVAFSPDGKTLASGSGDGVLGGGDGTVRLWDMATQQQIAALTGYQNKVSSVAFSPDGKTLASGSWDGTVRLWDLATHQWTGNTLRSTNAVSSVAFSPDGKVLAIGSFDDTVRLWDVASGRQIGQPLNGPTALVDSVAFSPDGKTLASGSYDGTVRLWNAATHRQIGNPLTRHAGAVYSVAFSPDGKTLASVSNDATGGAARSVDGIVQLWDVATGRQIGNPLTGHAGEVLSVAFSPDGKTLASCNADQTVRLWDVATGRQIGQPLTRNTSFVVDFVDAVAFSPDGKTLASGSYDGTVRLWDLATRRQIGNPLTGRGKVLSVAFSPDGKTLASGDDNDTARLWDVAYLPDTVQYLCVSAGRSLTRAEWTLYVPPGPAYQKVCP